jgi:putative chitinase
MTKRDGTRVPYDPKVPIDWRNPNQRISEYFTVGEVTKGDPERIPSDPYVIRNILLLADELDKARAAWGASIGVTSWYRPLSVNRRIGSGDGSQHVQGSAADVFTYDGRDREFEAFLDSHWGGGLGYGVKSGLGFTHLDTREGGWDKGPGTIRWDY